MVYRLSWLAGTVAILLALGRLNGLLHPSVEGVPWQIVILVAAFLGATITWTALAYRLSAALVAAINAGAWLVTALRIAAPETMWLVIPTWDSLERLQADLSYAADVMQGSVAPVIPATGIVVALLAIFWALGSLMVWGLQKGHPFIALVPPLGFYLQLATIQRGGAAIGWLIAFVLLAGLSLAAITHDERTSGVGRISGAGGGGLLLHSWSLAAVGAVALVAVLITTAIGPAVSAAGSIEWRQSRGLTGDFYGSISYNPFIGIQKSLVSGTDTPIFAVRVSGDTQPDRLYWRLLSMDAFNGVHWFANEPRIEVIDQAESYEDPRFEFVGPTNDVVQDVTILALQSEWIPAAYSPVAFSAQEVQVDQGVRVSETASLRFSALTYRGMTYRVLSEVPQPDFATLALAADGLPSDAFASAIEEGAVDESVFDTSPPEPIDDPPDLDRLTDLPDDFDERISGLARDITRGLEGDYEKALALESWLRDPANGFRYDTTVTPSSEENTLASWLLDETSPDFRAGYCEQYATALGAMGRAIGIPSRVVLGFTPGDQQADGTIVVRDRNAHAWVEFWMPTQGWVQFDSTPRSDFSYTTASTLPFDVVPFLEVPEIDSPSFLGGPNPLIEIAADDLAGPIATDGINGGPATFTLPGWMRSLPILAAITALILAIPAIKSIRRRRRGRALSEGDVAAAWREITERLADLGSPPDPGLTPMELASSIDHVMEPLADVYGESLYGRGKLSKARMALAERSFEKTEAAFEARYSPIRRLVSRWNPGSLVSRLRRSRG